METPLGDSDSAICAQGVTAPTHPRDLLLACLVLKQPGNPGLPGEGNLP